MDADEFPANDKSGPVAKRPERKKRVEAVVVNEVVERKPSVGKRFMRTFIQGDAKSVWESAVQQLIIPAAKSMAADGLKRAIEVMIFGEARTTGGVGYRPAGGFGYQAYNKVVTQMGVPVPNPAKMVQQGNFNEFVLKSRVEGEQVIDGLFGVLQEYGEVKVSDLKDLLQLSVLYTDLKWGWTDLSGASVDRVPDGYVLNLPRPEPLN